MEAAATVFWLVAALLVCSPDAESRTLHRQRRIVGGHPANISEVPYQLSLQMDGKHKCGAAIINEKWAITTGYCIHSIRSSRNITLRAGSSIREAGGSVHDVERIYLHNHYIPTYPDNDIALMKVKQSFKFGNVVKAAKLPEQNEEFPIGTTAVVAGWGTKNYGVAKLTRGLYMVEVPIIDFAECDKSYMYYGGVNARMICAAYPTGGRDSCQGDNGGGLVAEGKLVGLVSWAIGCARMEYPHVYTRVAAFRDWIRNTTNI